MRTQMLGLCRFSYLGGRGFQTVHQSLAERRAFLYDPGRLARRWTWFERVALPAWRAQSDPDFTLVVMTGPDLPEPWLGRLRALTRDIPQLRLELVPPLDAHLDACLAAVRPHLDPAAEVIGHFRHDDDDAVAIDYIARARADFAASVRLWRRHGRLCCDHARGVVLRAGPDGVAVEPRLIHNATAALTIWLPPDQPATAVHFAHWQVALSMPVVTLAGQVMYARTLHGDNDSGAVGAGWRWPAPAATDWARLLSRRFAIDLAGLDAAARAAASGG